MPPIPKPKPSSAHKPSRRTPATQTPSPPPAPRSSPPAQPHSEDSTLTIPTPLLTRILHSFTAAENTQNSTRISSAAISALGEYSRTFVREAIHRAAEERRREEERRGMVGGMGRGPAEVFLEVEDLEKVGPQLVLDF